MAFVASVCYGLLRAAMGCYGMPRAAIGCHELLWAVTGDMGSYCHGIAFETYVC